MLWTNIKWHFLLDSQCSSTYHILEEIHYTLHYSLVTTEQNSQQQLLQQQLSTTIVVGRLRMIDGWLEFYGILSMQVAASIM